MFPMEKAVWDLLNNNIKFNDEVYEYNLVINNDLIVNLMLLSTLSILSSLYL